MGYKSKIYTNTLASLESVRGLDGDKIRRLIDARPADVVKILSDFGWGEGEDDLEKLISKETSVLLSFVEENCADDNVKEFLLAPFVFNNAKAAYKRRVSGIDVASAYYDFAEESGIADKIFEGEYGELCTELAVVLTALDERLETGELTPREIDRELSEAMYKYMLRRGKTTRILKKYIKSQIDLFNLLVLMRCRKLGFDEKTLTENIIPGGTMDTAEAVAALTGGEDAYDNYLAGTEYDEVLRGGDFADVEKRIDDYLYELTETGSNNMLGNAPLINYFYRRLLELRTAKMIAVCNSGGESGEIKRRLRNIYE